jgi:hypothetical protein
MNFYKAIGLAFLVSSSAPSFAIECLIRPLDGNARLVRDSGEVLVASTSVYPRCEQIRAIGAVEVFFIGEDAKQQSVIANNERLAKLLPKASPVAPSDANKDTSLFTAIKYALAGHQRVRQGMVRSDESALAAEVLPTGKVLARSAPVQLELGFVSPSDVNSFVLFEGAREIFRMQKDLRLMTLPAAAFVQGKRYVWKLKTSAETAEGSYEINSREQLNADLGRAPNADVGATFSQTVIQADRLKELGYRFEGIMSILDFVRKN